MPRSRGSGRSMRSTAPPSRSAHTAAAPPPAAHHAPPTAPPSNAGAPQMGMFGQMATTAAGVAVGSAVGHTMANAVSGIFGGGGSEAPAQEQQQQQQVPMQQQASTFNEPMARSCDMDAKAYTRCLESTNEANMSVCQYYLDTLKACLEFRNSNSF
ncbi:hypothetical protein COEREDRAFT_10878 [Coemansia reversa NRRL 1564]|uniref:CHCH domain-containing protein n=1 Tax=Coemansia reversa (strain ATCC 12441 / NRRL 1564) TaxID=763665 RepID=A0A2G5B4L0_COERN|nr:hypothetical protein COEREDRAFT_10878 [Coemansia reversa NRRL 1564]|eukprot:PIA13940.1 hypothetical protein COEREDRAFT_10878 [Coemansia reversa NRRL 1564]